MLLAAFWFLVLSGGLIAAHFAPRAVPVMLVGLMLWSLRGATECIHSLTLATLLSYLNPGIADTDVNSGILVRVALIVAALRVVPLFRSSVVRILWPVWAFSLVAAVLSIGSSSSVPISLMKVVTFATAVTTVLTAYYALTPGQVARLQAWFATVAAFLVLSSLLTLRDPGIAYLRNGTGLQGILSHPQSLGVLLAPLAAWLLAALMFVRGRIVVAAVAAAIVAVTLYLTEARTGATAAIAGFVAAGITWMFSRRRAPLAAGSGRVVTAAILTAIALGAALSTGHLQEFAVKFLYKRSSEQEVASAFLQSRGGGIVSQWANFLARPISGHGFGVYAEGPPANDVVEIAGIPISAPVEKGFAFTAVLEETGILGGLFFALMIGSLGRECWRHPDPRWVAAFTSCILVNIGESIILAPGGIGLLDWLLIGLAMVSGRAVGTGARVTASAVAGPFAVRRFPNLLRNDAAH